MPPSTIREKGCGLTMLYVVAFQSSTAGHALLTLHLSSFVLYRVGCDARTTYQQHRHRSLQSSCPRCLHLSQSSPHPPINTSTLHTHHLILPPPTPHYLAIS